MTLKNDTIRQNTPWMDKKNKSSSTEFILGLDDFTKLWELAFNASTDMISIMDVNHDIVAVNNAAAKVMGCSSRKAKGQKCYQLIHQSNEPPLACPHRALLEDGKPHQSEYYEESLNTWMQVNVTPLYNSNKELVGSIHIARDITEKKRSEQAQRESEERYHHLSEATMDGVLLSEESTIVAANQVLADMMGYSIKEVIGMNLLKFVASHDRGRLIQTLRNPMTGAASFECVRKDGSTFPIEAHARAITYKGKMVYQTAIRDLTEQKRIEQDRIAHERMRGALEMAGAVCHEINQPLMALQGFMEILASRIALTEETSRSVENMEKQIERIKELSHKLMHITSYETKDYPGGQKIIDIDQASANGNDNLAEMDYHDDTN